MLILAEDQELQARLRADRDLLPRFIEEALRFESPVRGDFRLAKGAVTVGGVEIPAGDGDARQRRDEPGPRKFDDPDAFDVERANARNHVAFGRGVHSCPRPRWRTETCWSA